VGGYITRAALSRECAEPHAFRSSMSRSTAKNFLKVRTAGIRDRHLNTSACQVPERERINGHSGFEGGDCSSCRDRCRRRAMRCLISSRGPRRRTVGALYSAGGNERRSRSRFRLRYPTVYRPSVEVDKTSLDLIQERVGIGLFNFAWARARVVRSLRVADHMLGRSTNRPASAGLWLLECATPSRSRSTA